MTTTPTSPVVALRVGSLVAADWDARGLLAKQPFKKVPAEGATVEFTQSQLETILKDAAAETGPGKRPKDGEYRGTYKATRRLVKKLNAILEDFDAAAAAHAESLEDDEPEEGEFGPEDLGLAEGAKVKAAAVDVEKAAAKAAAAKPATPKWKGGKNDEDQSEYRLTDDAGEWVAVNVGDKTWQLVSPAGVVTTHTSLAEAKKAQAA